MDVGDCPDLVTGFSLHRGQCGTGSCAYAGLHADADADANVDANANADADANVDVAKVCPDHYQAM